MNEYTIKEIQENILRGYSPADLLDERVFNPPYSSEDVFLAILLLKQEGGVAV